MEQQKVTYNYSFEARLHMTKDISKMAFNQVRTRFEAYGLKMRPSWKKIRIYKGREVFAFLVFRGKTLAVCFALDPKKFVDSKYKGKDLSERRVLQKLHFLYEIVHP